MRKDFFKVIVERERRGGRYDRKGRKPQDLDDLPQKQGMKKAHKDRKSLNENLSPLKRFLYGAVGRKWDDVYSEICENINVNSTVQQHVKQHIFDFVEKDVKIANGKVFSRRAYRIDIELRDGSLYIDPASGYLKKYRSKSRVEQYKLPDLFSYQMNSFISGAKGILVFEKSSVKKAFKNPDSGKFDLFNSATEKHAAADFSFVLLNGRLGELKKFLILESEKIKKFKSPYFARLSELVDSAK